MLFRNPLAWIGFAAVLVPLAIHLLVRAPARPIVLASLRFVPRSPMRTLRRRFLDDGGLLVLRMALLAVAAAALADPLVASGCRQRRWDARIARAVVFDPRDAAHVEPRLRDLPPAVVVERVAVSDVRAGLAAAVRWLERAPPARRELVVVGHLALGTLDAPELRDVPATIGLRFLTLETAAAPRPLAGPPLTRPGRDGGIDLVRASVTVDGERTVATSTRSGETLAIEDTPSGVLVAALALHGRAPARARPALRAAVQAALADGVAVPADATRPIVLMLDDDASSPGAAASTAIPAWMGDAIARMAADAGLAAEARGVRATVRPPLSRDWISVIADADGRTIVAAAPGEADASARTPGTPSDARPAALLLAVRAAPTSPLVPALVRSALQARMPPPREIYRDAETLAVSASELARRSRPASPVARDGNGGVASDRRGAWLLVLGLLGVESLWRHRRRRAETGKETGARAA